MPKPNSPRVAFQGERGAYSEIAARRFFGDTIELLPCESFDLVFKTVETRKADTGIVPIENSQAGCIHQNYDLLLKHRLRIVGELNLRVEHNLIGHPGTSLKSIRMVFSHPQALMQCQRNTAKLKGVRIVSAYDTAGSVKKIKEEEKPEERAAIASELAAKTYGMKILKKGIQDNPENFTRFHLAKDADAAFEREQRPPRVFLKNVPGALSFTERFCLRDIDLYKIESRPLHGNLGSISSTSILPGVPRPKLPQCPGTPG
jgi:prephenate dehydratase